MIAYDCRECFLLSVPGLCALRSKAFSLAPGCWDCAVLHVSLYEVISSGKCISNAVELGVGVKGAVRRKAWVW